MHQNIKNNHTKLLDAKLYNGKYYDFMIYKGETTKQTLGDINNLAIADFTLLNIVSGVLYSDVVWSAATNGGVEMEDIGFTGMDNGLIHFQKDRITNEQFVDLYLNSKYKIESGDTRLFLTPITGNTQMYEYPMFLVEDGDEKYIACKGGFYQGFFKLEGFDYQVLPNKFDNDMVLHFDIRPRGDYEVGSETVNFIHPENKGIFFFMGARAENKFWPFYKTNSAVTESMKKIDAQTEGYFDGCGEDGEIYNIHNNTVITNQEWLLKELPEPPKEEGYFIVGDGYYAFDGERDITKGIIKKNQGPTITAKPNIGTTFLNTYDFNSNSVCGCVDCQKEPTKEETNEGHCPDCCENYFHDDYFDNRCPEEDNGKAIVDEYQSSGITIDFDGSRDTDSDGHIVNRKGYYGFETDNKFLLFDRTDSGYTTHNWIEGTKVHFESRKNWPNANYFLLMDRTPTGYTTHTIDQYNEEHSYDYNLYKDAKNNVFCLKITENGAIGYKYGILDCDEENPNHYKVVEEYSKDGLIKSDEWNSINVKFSIMNPPAHKCDNRSRLMKIMIYVNGFLVFISKELPAINFKALDDVYQKQEAVPFNISLGGGSLGLLETILPDYYAISEYVLPIERDFCGTFLGDIKSFKMYSGFINYSAIADYLS